MCPNTINIYGFIIKTNCIQRQAKREEGGLVAHINISFWERREFDFTSPFPPICWGFNFHCQGFPTLAVPASLLPWLPACPYRLSDIYRVLGGSSYTYYHQGIPTNHILTSTVGKCVLTRFDWNTGILSRIPKDHEQTYKFHKNLFILLKFMSIQSTLSS